MGVALLFGALAVAVIVVLAIAVDLPQSALWTAAVGAAVATFFLAMAVRHFRAIDGEIELTDKGIVQRYGDESNAVAWALIRDVRLFVHEVRDAPDEPRMAVLDKAENTLFDWDRRRVVGWKRLHQAILAGIRLHHGGLPGTGPDTGDGLSRRPGDTPRVRAILRRLRGGRPPEQAEVPGPHPLVVFLYMALALIALFAIVQAIG